jgi:hypothetical protein
LFLAFTTWMVSLRFGWRITISKMRHELQRGLV